MLSRRISLYLDSSLKWFWLLFAVLGLTGSCLFLTDTDSKPTYFVATRELDSDLPAELVDTAGPFRAEIHRQFADSLVERILRIAEAVYPPRDSVLQSVWRPDPDAEGYAGPLWWADNFDGVRLPYALTGAAVNYYLELIVAYQQGNFEAAGTIQMLSARFSYDASVTWYESFEYENVAFEKVFVAELNLRWGNLCGSLCGLWFGKERVVVLGADGQLMDVFGDGPVSAVVS